MSPARVMDEVTRHTIQFLGEAHEHLLPLLAGRGHFRRLFADAAGAADRDGQLEVGAVYGAIGAWVQAAAAFGDAGTRFAAAVTALPEQLGDVEALLNSLLDPDAVLRRGRPPRGPGAPATSGEGEGEGEGEGSGSGSGSGS